jgi:hypothetical protein
VGRAAINDPPVHSLLGESVLGSGTRCGSVADDRCP